MKTVTRWMLWVTAIVAVALVGYGCAATSEQDTPVATSTPVPTATWTPVPAPTNTVDPTSTPAVDVDGLVLTWLREGGIAGFCDAVSVYGNGQVEVSWCRGNRPRERSSLSAEQRAQLQAWVRAYAAYEYEHQDQAVADGMRVRLTFAGRGSQQVSDAERQAMLDWVSALVPPRPAGPPLPMEPTMSPGAWPIYMLTSDVSIEYPVGWSPSPGGYDGTQESVSFVSPDADVVPVIVEVYHRPISERAIADPYTWQPNEGGYEVHWARSISTAGGLSGLEFVWGAYSKAEEQWDTPPSLMAVLYSPEHELDIRLATSFDRSALDMIQTAGYTETVDARFGILRRMAQSLRVRLDTRPAKPRSWSGDAVLYAQGERLRSLPYRAVFDRPEIKSVYGAIVGSEGHTIYLSLNALASSPDGRWVTANDPLPSGPEVQQPGTTWLIDLATGELTSLDSPAAAVTWSPDSRYLTYARGDAVYVLELTGRGEPAAVFQRPGLRLLAARWSPTGEWIAIAGTDALFSDENVLMHWVVSPDGGTVVELGAMPLPRTQWSARDIEWAPDGSLFATYQGILLTLDGKQIPVWESSDNLPASLPPTWAAALYLRDTAGGEIRPNRFSRGGERIAHGNVYIFDLASQKDVRVSVLPDRRVAEIRWSTSDEWLIVGATAAPRTQTSQFWGEIYAVRPEPGSTPELLIEGEGVYLLDVIPDVSYIAGGDAEISPDRFLLVDQSAQRMYVYEDDVPIRELPVSTGMPTSVTLTRAWTGTVGKDLGSGGVDGGMVADFKWVLFQDLYGSILIHSVPYTRQGDRKVYDQLDALGIRPASRGCVRISPEDAQWLKSWDPVGVPIEITAWPGPVEQVTGA